MSVKVCDRSLSKLEAVYQATKVRELLHDLCLRDFAIKDVDTIVRKKIAFRVDPTAHLEKYVMILNESKHVINHLADDLLVTARAANRNSLKNRKGCERRLEYQEKALDDCEMIVAKLQDIASMFLVDLNRYRPCMEALDYEITLLKGWIKHTNKVMKKYTRGSV